MRKQMFKKVLYLKITFLFLLLSSGLTNLVFSEVLLKESSLSRKTAVVDKDKNGAPLVRLAQNQIKDSESFGEIVSLNTKESGLSSTVSIESTRPVQYTAFKLLNPLRLVLDFPKMNPGNLTSRIQVDKGIVDFIRPIHFKESNVLRLEIVLNQSVDYEIKKPRKNELIVSLQSSNPARLEELAHSSLPDSPETKSSDEVASAIEPKDDGNRDTCFPMLYGKKEEISLDFQEADVRNFFRTFSEISGFNMILSSEVGGLMSIRLKNVPWNEAMEIVLSNNNLGRECFDNNFVRIATKAVLASEESARVAEQARLAAERTNEENAQDLVTEVVRIDNADITELSTNLTALKSARPDAQITVDTRTNTLILNDLRKHVDDMLETIRILDIPTPQVLIEAKIVEISKNYSEKLGIQWGINRPLGANNGEGQTVGVLGPDGGRFMVNLGQGLTSTTGVAGFDLTLGNLINGAALNIALSALETEGKSRTLSSPKVTVADNKEARIQSGQQIPYQVTSAEGNSIQFIDAELTLAVTPHVTSDDRIYMNIDTTKNGADLDVNVAGVPVITSEETHTEVLVGNGETTVLAGIYDTTIKENTKEVPLFSKIPILGNLFRSYEDTDTISELMVFITPTIIKTK